MEVEKFLQKVEDEKENTKAGVPADSFKGLPMDELISPPFLELVPVPALKIDNVDVNFQMEVTDTSTSKNSENADLSADMTPKWFEYSVSVQGKVKASRENTSSTDQNEKYQVSVSASQRPQAEGLSKLMDTMASCIEPLDKKE